MVFHESPLILHLYTLFEPILIDRSTLTFIILDLVTCAILGEVGRLFAEELLKLQKANKNDFHPEASSILISSNIINTLPKTLAIFYLFNPYLIINCAAKTTTLWDNLLICTALLGQVKGSRWIGTAALSLATYQAFYPLVLIFPLAIQIAQNEGIYNTLS